MLALNNSNHQTTSNHPGLRIPILYWAQWFVVAVALGDVEGGCIEKTRVVNSYYNIDLFNSQYLTSSQKSVQ